jgi:hypothetical protein
VLYVDIDLDRFGMIIDLTQFLYDLYFYHDELDISNVSIGNKRRSENLG